MFDDLTPRYLPDVLTTIDGRKRVIGTTFYPAGVDRGSDCPLRLDIGALKVKLTDDCVRWFGCADAYINSELRFVVIGTNARDEVRMTWKPVPTDKRANHHQ